MDMANSVETGSGGSTETPPTPPTGEEVAARLRGEDTPPPPEPPPGTRAERPAEPSVVVTEPTRTASEPAPPPRPSAERTTDDTEAGLERADERATAKEKAVKNIEDAAALLAEAKDAESRALYTKIIQEQTAILADSETAKPKTTPERPRKTKEEREAEKAARREELKEVVEKRDEARAKASELPLNSRETPEDYDSEESREVVEAHYDAWRLAEKAAKLDDTGTEKVVLSRHQVEALREYALEQAGVAKATGDTEAEAQYRRDAAVLKSRIKDVGKEQDDFDPREKYPMRSVRSENSEVVPPLADEEFELDKFRGKLDPTPKPDPEPQPDPIPDPEPRPDPIPDPEPQPTPEPGPIEPIPPVPEIAEAQAAYDEAVEKWAAARIRSERLLSRGEDKENLAREKENMDRAFELYCAALGQQHVENMRAGQRNVELSENYVGQSESIQRNLDHQRSLPPADRDPRYREYTDAQFAADIQEQIDYRAEQARYQAESNAKLQAELERWSQLKTEELMKVRAKVDAEMLRQRTEKHPRLAKMNEWLKKHPKTRMAAGLALTAIGVTGTVTGLAPLAIIGFGGRTALGAFGAYNAARGAGEMVGNSKRFGVGENNKANIGEELGVQEKQTTARRWSKRAGAAAAAIVGAIGAYKLVNAIDGPPPRPDADHRYGSINNGELNDRLANGEYISGPERVEAIARLKSVIGEDLYNQLGQEQREALLLLKNDQIDQAPEYFQHLAAGHFG